MGDKFVFDVDVTPNGIFVVELPIATWAEEYRIVQTDDPEEALADMDQFIEDALAARGRLAELVKDES